MTTEDFDNPEIEDRWCATQRSQVVNYLNETKVEHGEIGELPAWHVPPYVAVWVVESRINTGWVGWWVISGNLPTDYVSADMIKHPREAIRAFAKTWAEVSGYMLRGQSHPSVKKWKPV
jgi:hypothetical protein